MKKTTSELLRTIADIIDLDDSTETPGESPQESVSSLLYEAISQSGYRFRTANALSAEIGHSPDLICSVARMEQSDFVVSVKRETGETIIRLNSSPVEASGEASDAPEMPIPSNETMRSIIRNYIDESGFRFLTVGTLAEFSGYKVGEILVACIGSTGLVVSVRRADNTVIIRLA